MPAYTIHDIRVKSPDPERDQGILDTSRNSLIETMIIPSQTIEKDRIENVVKVSRVKQPSFVNLQEGVKGSKNTYKTVSTRLKPFAKLVEFNSHTIRLEMSDFDSETEMDREVTDVSTDLFEDGVRQLYAGQANDPKGFKGFPDFATLNFDALHINVNWHKTYSAGVDFTAASDRFTTVYLVRIAQGTTREALRMEKTGLRWVWQARNGDAAITFDERRKVSVSTGGGKFRQDIHQFLEGFWALQSKSPYDVIAIHNIPLFYLEGFALEKVINSVWVKLRTGETAPNGILIDRELLAPWVNNRSIESKQSPLKALDGPLGDRVQVLDQFGPNLPIFLSEFLPESLHKADLTNVAPIWKESA